MAEIKSQIRLSTTDLEGVVVAAQKTSRIKEPIAQHWIDQAILKRRELLHMQLSNGKPTQDPRLADKTLMKEQRSAIKETIQNEIGDEIYNWIIQQPPHHYNVLPQDSRKLET